MYTLKYLHHKFYPILLKCIITMGLYWQFFYVCLCVYRLLYEYSELYRVKISLGVYKNWLKNHTCMMHCFREKSKSVISFNVLKINFIGITGNSKKDKTKIPLDFFFYGNIWRNWIIKTQILQTLLLVYLLLLLL